MEREKEMSDFRSAYYQKIDKSNSAKAISEFEKHHDDWFSIVPYMQQCDLYGDCLMVYSIAANLEHSLEKTKKLASYIKEFEDYEYSPHNYLESLYHNLGICWHGLGNLYDGYAIEAFKKYIFYLLGISSYIAYSPVCYSFRRCSPYLYQSLINEQIGISSPAAFNDPFDSPVISMLDNYDDVAKLIRRAYLESVKIACFISNTKLPEMKEGNIVREPKNAGDAPEYENMLMWAHYADNHKGICIKYSFSSSLTHVYSRPGEPVRYFQDVEYIADLSPLQANDSISIKNAFFAKSNDWKYENELRLLQCDPAGKGDFGSIDAPDCIEAIYFGVRCPQREIDTIRKIMKRRSLVNRKRQLINNKMQDIEERLPVKFYKMEFDKSSFGKLTAVEI